jgi:hypothetical protein
MTDDLLLLRLLAPKAFRGIRFYCWLLFWLTFLTLSLGLVIEFLSPSASKATEPQHLKGSSKVIRDYRLPESTTKPRKPDFRNQGSK